MITARQLDEGCLLSYKRGIETMSRLVVAEKPSVAQSIAAVLGAKTKRDGYLEGNGWIVSWCIGHLVELAPADGYDERYAKWKYEDLPILPAPWQYIVSESTKKQFSVLKKLMNDIDVDYVICATDAGREGELIFRLVYEKVGCRKPVKRLWISSLEERAIRDGFAALRDGREYDCLYKAALCRAQADWLVGINATRLFSLLYGQTLNVGRVMSPTLALVVQREAAISGFVPEKFYTVQLSCGMTAVSDRIRERKDAKALAAQCHLGKAVVESVEYREKTEKPPKLYDLTGLQRDANRLFGFTAQQTLDYVQSLYEKKLCTYPRTDSRYLTEDMKDKLPSLIRSVADKLPFTAGLQLGIYVEQVIDNSKVSDHHAILPTSAMAEHDLQTLPSGERSILQLICVRLLCAVGDVHKYEECKAVVKCCDYVFTAKSRTTTQMGWKIPEMTFRGAARLGTGEKDISLPVLAKGQVLSPIMASVKEGKTSPPKSFTEDTLLSAMENAGADDASEDAERKGLGTPATRAGIIEKLVKAGFITRHGEGKTQHLLPTDKAKALISVLPETIRSASMTAEWEHRLKQIERGNEAGEKFIGDIEHMVRELVKNCRLAENAADVFPSDRERIGTCPRCGASVSETGKGFFCENRVCRFGIWKDNRFFSSKGQKVTAKIVAPLLKEGFVQLTDLHSVKSGKCYTATVFLDDSAEDMPRFRLEFERKDRK